MVFKPRGVAAVIILAATNAVKNLLAVLVEEAGELADGIGVNQCRFITIKLRFFLSIINDEGVITLLVEIDFNPLAAINTLSFEFNCSHCSLYFR